MNTLELNKIHNMDCIEGLKMIESDSVNCCVTSPPYWNLRDYGVDGQIGLELTMPEYLGKMVEVFREVWRVLKSDGTLWLNLGDTYCSTAPGTMGDNLHIEGTKEATKRARKVMRPQTPEGLKPKDLCGIPWRTAFALQDDGWYLRSDIIWAKPNPMPESVTDRPTKSHEYIFLLSKSPKYYYDHELIKELCTQDEFANGFRGGSYCNNSTHDNSDGGKRKNKGNYKVPAGWDTEKGSHGNFHREGRRKSPPGEYGGGGSGFIGHSGNYKADGTEYSTRNKRTIWNVATNPFPEAHFATFPPKLIEPCILAGCPVNGVVLDPFMGSGTTAMVALQNQRKFIGFELNPEYIKIAEKVRLNNLQLKIV